MAELALRREKGLEDFAVDALENAKGDNVKASELMAKALKKKPTFCEQLILMGCAKVIQDVRLHSRRAAMKVVSINSPGVQPGGQAAGRRLETMARSNLMNFVLPNNKRLAQAKREDIAAASDFYLKQGRTMVHHGRWLALCAQSVPAGKRLEDVMSEERLLELRNEAERNGHD